jgi:hypothetical protein
MFIIHHTYIKIQKLRYLKSIQNCTGSYLFNFFLCELVHAKNMNGCKYLGRNSVGSLNRYMYVFMYRYMFSESLKT